MPSFARAACPCPTVAQGPPGQGAKARFLSRNALAAQRLFFEVDQCLGRTPPGQGLWAEMGPTNVPSNRPGPMICPLDHWSGSTMVPTGGNAVGFSSVVVVADDHRALP